MGGACGTYGGADDFGINSIILIQMGNNKSWPPTD